MAAALATLQLFEVVIWGPDKNRPLFRVSVQAFSEDEAKADGLSAFGRARAPDSARGVKIERIERVDVLSGIHLNPARRQQSLFEDLADACARAGASIDEMQGAFVNLLLTAVQRRCVKLDGAESRWDELTGRGKEALRRRYLGSGVSSPAQAASAEMEIAKRLLTS